mgnify:CR=1 FL=1
MSLLVSRNTGILILMPVGRLDTYTSPEAESTIRRCIDEGERRIVMDFAQTSYLSSAGLRVILTTAKRLKAPEGGFALCNVPETVRQVLEMTGLANLIPNHPTLDEAITSLAPPAAG